MLGQWRQNGPRRRHEEPWVKIVVLSVLLLCVFSGLACYAIEDDESQLLQPPSKAPPTPATDPPLDSAALPPIQRLQRHMQFSSPPLPQQENSSSPNLLSSSDDAEEERRSDLTREVEAVTGGPERNRQVEKQVNYPEDLLVPRPFDASAPSSEVEFSKADADGPEENMPSPADSTRVTALGLPETASASFPAPAFSADEETHTSSHFDGADVPSQTEEESQAPGSRVLRTVVYGNIHQTAYYFADVFVGSGKPQRQSLILDTGSSVMAFPCDQCKVCGRHIDAAFQCDASPTCSNLPCSSNCAFCDARRQSCAYRVSYMEGSSLQGFWNTDIVLLPPPPPVVKQRGRAGNQSQTSTNVFDSASLRAAYSSPDSLRQLLASANSPQMPSSIRAGGLNVLGAARGEALAATSGFASPASWDASWSEQVQEVGIPCAFGCHIEETNLFVSQRASGIWGLEVYNAFGPASFPFTVLLSDLPSAQGPPTLNGGDARHGHRLSGASIFNRIVSEQDSSRPTSSSEGSPPEADSASVVESSVKPKRRVFSLCLSEHGGSLSFGDDHGEFHLRPPAWTPVLKISDSYTVRLAALKVGGAFVALREHHSLQDAERVASLAEERYRNAARDAVPGPTSSIAARDSFTVLIDSGSTLAYFPKELYVHLVQAIEEYLLANRGGRQTRRLEEEVQEKTKTRDETDSFLDPMRHGRLKRPLLGETVEVASEGKDAGNSESSLEPRRPSSLSDFESGNALSAKIAFLDAPHRRLHPQEREGEAGEGAETEGIKTATFAAIAPNPMAYPRPSSLHPSDASVVAAFNASKNGLFSVRRADPTMASAFRSEPQRRSKIPSFSNGSEAESSTSNASAALWGDPQMEVAVPNEGSEVTDSEALPILAALSAVPPDVYSEQAAYELLPPSAPRRKSQAIKVETSAGEVCFFLPRSRQDLDQFPLIELLFWPPSRGEVTFQHDSQSASSALWVQWEPSSYLYSKGNEHYRCLALSDDASSRDSAVLGSSFFIGKDVIIDLEKQRLGFAAAACPSIRLKDRPELPRRGSPNPASVLSSLSSQQ